MSKLYYVGHDDGRKVYEHKRLLRLYVQTEPCREEELSLFLTRHRKKAELACERTNEVWSGFKVRRFKKS